MDPPQPFGRYSGATTLREYKVDLPREARPFAHVFDKKMATPAAGEEDPEPTRKEDFWVVDPELGTVVRHHLYPRKRLYVPDEHDVQRFPNISPESFAEVGGATSFTTISTNMVLNVRTPGWTCRTYLVTTTVEPTEFKRALAVRSKTEAMREAKQGRFKDVQSNGLNLSGNRPCYVEAGECYDV